MECPNPVIRELDQAAINRLLSNQDDNQAFVTDVMISIIGALIGTIALIIIVNEALTRNHFLRSPLLPVSFCLVLLQVIAASVALAMAKGNIDSLSVKLCPNSNITNAQLNCNLSGDKFLFYYNLNIRYDGDKMINIDSPKRTISQDRELINPDLLVGHSLNLWCTKSGKTTLTNRNEQYNNSFVFFLVYLVTVVFSSFCSFIIMIIVSKRRNPDYVQLQ